MKTPKLNLNSIFTMLVLTCLISCSNPNEIEKLNPELSLTQTREVLKEHIQAHYDADPKKAALFLADNFKYYGPDNQVYNSRKDVENGYTEMYESIEIKELEYVSENFEVFENRAIELGHWVLKMSPKDAETDTLMTSKERYLFEWKYNEEWKLNKAVSVHFE